MFDAGSHFGHQTRKWNPKMRPFIYGSRSGIHIIDLGKTEGLAQKAFNFIEQVVGETLDVLFVGTKVQAREILEGEAKRCSMPYINQRWLGGTLTNFSTIKKSIDRLLDLEKRRAENDFAGFTKRELLSVDREIQKLNRALGGIRSMKRLPGCIFVIDPSLEHIAVHEANILGIPVVAITDSNCNPDPINYVIPANDDAIRSIQLFSTKAADACLAGLNLREQKAREVEARKVGEGQKRSTRKAQEVGGSGKAYVSRPDAFEEGKDLEGFSATVEEKESSSLEGPEQEKDKT